MRDSDPKKIMLDSTLTEILKCFTCPSSLLGSKLQATNYFVRTFTIGHFWLVSSYQQLSLLFFPFFFP